MKNQQKIDMRNEVKMRMQKDADLLKDKSWIITDKILKNQHIFSAKVWFIYLSLADEVDTFPLIETLFLENKKVCVPKIINNQMYPIEIQGFQDIQKWKYGIFEPYSNTVFEEEIDVAIIPARAFDTEKNRLWRGGWYYDKFLDWKEVFKLAIAFDFQIFPKIPSEKHDIKMDMILTDISQIGEGIFSWKKGF